MSTSGKIVFPWADFNGKVPLQNNNRDGVYCSSMATSLPLNYFLKTSSVNILGQGNNKKATGKRQFQTPSSLLFFLVFASSGLYFK